jgi:hypothetical protein
MDVIMLMVNMVGKYYSTKVMEWYKVPHSKVLKGFNKVRLEHGFLSGGRCQHNILDGNAYGWVGIN